MAFSEIFYHIRIDIEHREKPLHTITSKLIETRIEELVSSIGGDFLAFKNLGDHVHMLLGSLPEVSPDNLVTEIRDSTTEMVAGMGRGEKLDWSRAYGVVSVSRSHLDVLEKYIETQEERHKSGNINETLEKTE